MSQHTPDQKFQNDLIKELDKFNFTLDKISDTLSKMVSLLPKPPAQ
jgi:hypothetical protein